MSCPPTIDQTGLRKLGHDQPRHRIALVEDIDLGAGGPARLGFGGFKEVGNPSLA